MRVPENFLTSKYLKVSSAGNFSAPGPRRFYDLSLRSITQYPG